MPRLSDNDNKKQSSTDGTSFIEVLIVMAISAILMTVGVINTLHYVNHQNLDTEAKAIAAMLHDAQTRSMGQEEGSRWGVYFKNETAGTRDSYSFFKADEALVGNPSYTDVPGQTLEQRTIRTNIGLTDPIESQRTIVLFSKITGLPSSASTISLELISDPTATRTITVNSNGRIDYQ